MQHSEEQWELFHSASRGVATAHVSHGNVIVLFL